MVTNINVPLDDSDYKKLIEVKGKMTWREVLLEWCSKTGKTEVNPQQESKRSFR